mgnify:CR=1 FL=1
MSDDTSLTARLRDAVARLAPSQDGDPSPQARDEETTAKSDDATVKGTMNGIFETINL